jgi:integrase
MKPRALTPAVIANLRPGRHRDSAGLYLQVRTAKDGSPTRSWLFRYMIAGQPREAGLGVYPEISIARARDLAGDWRAKIKAPDPIDPLADMREKKAALAKAAAQDAKTFGVVAEEWLALRKQEWRSRVYRTQVDQLLHSKCKAIWDKPVRTIDRDDVLEVLRPVWEATAKTGANLRMYLEAILAKAKAAKLRDGENPAAWAENMEHEFPSPSKRKIQHYAALPVDDAPAFAAELRARPEIQARALEFLMLTGVRTGDVLKMTFSQVDDWDYPSVWTIPAILKRKEVEPKPFRVPLSKRAAELLKGLTEQVENPYVFPSRIAGKGLGENTLADLMKELRPGYPPHGLRSTFRDWTATRTNFPSEVAELAITHVVGNRTERAYQRDDLLDKRRLLAEAWSSYLAAPPSAGNVTPIRAVR